MGPIMGQARAGVVADSMKGWAVMQSHRGLPDATRNHVAGTALWDGATEASPVQQPLFTICPGEACAGLPCGRLPLRGTGP